MPDLADLFAAIGLERRSAPTAIIGHAALEVATGSGLPWLAIRAGEPAREARRLARRLASRGHIAGVAALDGSHRRLALAVAFGRAPTLEIRLRAPEPLALDCLGRLGAPQPGALAAAAYAADVLGAESVGTRFFREFRRLLERMEAALPQRTPTADRRALALLQLTRVLFLYFVQGKGWLDGRPDFLARQVDATLARRRHLGRSLLRPLFFGTLNRPPAERRRAAALFGAIPFLNGGLFEPHALERRWPADLPNAIWRSAFDDLFERFRFTAGGRAEHGAVAPEMLGRVFEGVMTPGARRASGTYYTPAPLVRRVLRAGAAALLARRLGCTGAAAEAHLDEHSAAAAAALRDVTVLDPAAGSGAFLLGALDLLTGLRTAHGERLTEARRAVLRRNLFGVDLSAAAVRLAELRLWLAVVADDPTTDPRAVEPLPNLDCLVRQGDSLHDPAGSGAAPAASPELASLRSRLVIASGAEKAALARSLRAAEANAAVTRLGAAERMLDRRIADCIAAAGAPTLFGQKKGLDRDARRLLRDLRARRRATRELIRRAARDGELPWFSYSVHFGDVLAAGGFDLVTGNPPWVRAEQLPREQRQRLAACFRWWRGGRDGRGYAHLPDLAVAFLERSFDLAAPNGAVALVVPAKLMSASWGAAARAALAHDVTLHVAADLIHDRAARFEATTYPMALVVTPGPPSAGHRLRTSLGTSSRRTTRQARLSGAPWVLTRTALERLRDRLVATHPSLGERFRCQLGVKTGANDLFVARAPDVEEELLRWAVRGRDLQPFVASPTLRLIWTHGADDRPRATLPPRATRHFAPHRRRLLARADHDGGAPWMLFRTGPALAPHRVVWADLARRLVAAPLTPPAAGALIPLNSCYVLVAPSSAIARTVAAWLNARPIGRLAAVGAVPAAGGARRYTARAVGALPLPAEACRDDELIRLAGRLANDPSQLALLQEELDDRVLAHLGVPAGERRALLAEDGTGNRR